jgi:hypothetical protein
MKKLSTAFAALALFAAALSLPSKADYLDDVTSTPRYQRFITNYSFDELLLLANPKCASFGFRGADATILAALNKVEPIFSVRSSSKGTKQFWEATFKEYGAMLAADYMSFSVDEAVYLASFDKDGCLVTSKVLQGELAKEFLLRMSKHES